MKKLLCGAILAALLLSPWAPDKDTRTVERGKSDARTFRHTGTKNWCVNITEQFGERGRVYATVFNLTDKPVLAKIAVKVAGESVAELVTGSSVAVADGLSTLDLPPEIVRGLVFDKSNLFTCVQSQNMP